MVETILMIGSIFLLIAISISRLSGKFGVPVLFFFLIVGMFFGKGGFGLGVHVTDLKVAQSVGMIALSIILFAGGLGTKFSDVKPVITPGVFLATFGGMITAVVTGVFIYYLTQSAFSAVTFSLPVSLLLASTMASTDSASVFNVLRTRNIGLKNNLQPMLELESGSNDPMAYLLTILMIDISMKTQTDLSPWNITSHVLSELVLGVAIGAMMGKVATLFANKIRLSNSSLSSLQMLATVFLTYTLTVNLGGNGYLAVYLAGIVVGNNKIKYKLEISLFMDGVTWLMQIVMFVILGFLVNPRDLILVAPVGLLIGLFVMCIGRPFAVFACLWPFDKIKWKDKLFISWVGLRGAVPILFATYPIVKGVEGADMIFNIVFFITLLSLAFQGTTIPLVAEKLGLVQKTVKHGNNDFGILFPEDLETELYDMSVTKEMLEKGHSLKDIELENGSLVILVKRGGKFMVPNGNLDIHEEDKLLVIHETIGNDNTPFFK